MREMSVGRKGIFKKKSLYLFFLKKIIEWTLLQSGGARKNIEPFTFWRKTKIENTRNLTKNTKKTGGANTSPHIWCSETEIYGNNQTKIIKENKRNETVEMGFAQTKKQKNSKNRENWTDKKK